MKLTESTPLVAIFTGPHGAGKDTLEQEVRLRSQHIGRLVRHITRPRAENEIQGETYHFISPDEFERLAESKSFIQFNKYPDGSSGLTYDEISNKQKKFDTLSISTNYLEAIDLKESLAKLAISSLTFFIIPCTQTEFISDENTYLQTLHERLHSRGRRSDNIEARLDVAREYRSRYIASTDHSTRLIENVNGGLLTATSTILNDLATAPADP